MYTDQIGAEYYYKLGITKIWDEGIDVNTLESLKINTNYNVFWSFAKPLVFGEETTPFFMMDTDMIVWNNISHLINGDLMVIHSEPFDEFNAYMPKQFLLAPPGYVWEDWDWTATPCNTALLYCAHNQLKNYYSEKAFEFMHNNSIEEDFKDFCTYVLFVEQRLLPMCAKKLGVEIKPFIDGRDRNHLMDGSKNNLFTHLWTYKSILRTNKYHRKKLCLRCIDRILTDFPEYVHTLIQIPHIRKYMGDITNDEYEK